MVVDSGTVVWSTADNTISVSVSSCSDNGAVNVSASTIAAKSGAVLVVSGVGGGAASGVSDSGLSNVIVTVMTVSATRTAAAAMRRLTDMRAWLKA